MAHGGVGGAVRWRGERLPLCLGLDLYLGVPRRDGVQVGDEGLLSLLERRFRGGLAG